MKIMFCKLFLSILLIFQTFVNNFTVNSQECDNLSAFSPNLTVLEGSISDGGNGKQNASISGKNTIDLTDGTKLHLMCESNEPVLWIIPHPNYEILDETPEHVEIEHTFDKETGKWVSHLVISVVMWSDVGYYSCHYNSSKITDENSQNSVYVFVNSSNLEHLFAPDNIHDFPHMASVHNKSARINCRPTSRDITITLWKHESDGNYTELYIGEQYGITYDPKFGFAVQRLTLDKVVCKAQYRDVTQSITVSVQFSGSNEYYPEIYYEKVKYAFVGDNFTQKCAKDMSAEIPDDKNVKYEFVGDNFTLQCLVRMTTSVRTSLDWKSKNLCSDTGRIIIGDTAPVTVNGVKFITRNITVTNAQKSDEGYYRCLATDFSLESKEAKQFIQIHEKAHLNLTIMNAHIKPKCMEDYNLEVLIDAMPSDINALSLKWTRNDRIINNDCRIFKENDTIIAVLYINAFSAKYSGVYGIQTNLLNRTNAYASIELSVDECRVWKNLTEKPSNGNSENDQIVLIVVFAVVGSVLLVMSVFLGRKIREERRQKRELEFLSYNLFENGQMEMINPDLPLGDQIDLLPYDTKWEFSRDNLKLGQILGQGAFGRVVRAEAYGVEDSCSVSSVSTTVAVKMLKEKADLSQRKALLAELKILIHVGRHMNIVNLVGAVTKDLIKGELMVIVEYCRYGNIRSFLLAKRDCFVNQLNTETDEIDPSVTEPPALNHSYVNGSVVVNNNVEYQNIVVDKEIPQCRSRYVTTSDLISYVFQCSKGMEYLTSKKLIHRDLAARNVLLADDDVVKICDFGLARDCYNYDNYVKKGEGPLPIKWMAIESMRDKVFTAKSDVWSFGIFCWEIFTLGSSPYPGLELDEEFYKRLCDGYRMDKPLYATNNIYRIMNDCWKCEPSDRPDFEQLSKQLTNMMEVNAIKRYEYQLEKYKTRISGENGVEYLRMISDTETIGTNVDEYVDMTTSGDDDEQRLAMIVGSNKTDYDKLKNVRPIYRNSPVTDQPMESVPMIQL